MNKLLKLNHVWENGLIPKDIKTIHGEEIIIHSQGFKHSDNQYKQAIIKIGGVTWLGNVAICERSTDVFKLEQKVKSALILLIVCEQDAEIFADGRKQLPTIVINDNIKI